ncbi:MAG: hypothetical protein GF364_06460, partial [Candidatus Lokiarchaeota archaeon]|nr:hypothetical protein [Candidatus Lokiarchaeota archaeon]
MNYQNSTKIYRSSIHMEQKNYSKERLKRNSNFLGAPIDQIEADLKDPSKRYQPFARWWWFGSAITEEELEYELNQMDKKHFGGVEIQPIYSALKEDALEGKKLIEWLSPKWLKLVDFTIKTCKKLKIKVDLTFGSGWPFGGPHISKDMASSRLKSKKVSIWGGKQITIPISKLCPEDRPLIAVVAIKSYLIKKKHDSVTDLTSNIKKNGLVWNAPKGHWLIFGFYVGLTNQKVKRATPGAEGLVMDHLSKDAFIIHANHIENALNQKFMGDFGKYFRAFFCDSWE